MKLAILLLLVCLAGGAVAYGVPGTATVVVNATQGAISVGNQTQYWDVGQLNGTSLDFLLNVTLDNGSFELSPGQRLLMTGAWESLNLTCDAVNATPNVSACVNTTVLVNQTVYVAQNGTTVYPCEVNVSLEENQTLDRSDGLCRVHVFCDPPGQSYCTQQNGSSVSITKNVTIVKSGNQLQIVLENYTQSIDVNFLNGTTQLPAVFTCPTDPINLSSEVEARQMFDVCMNFFPLERDWLNLTINKCFDNFDAYRDFVKEHDKTVYESNQALSDCRADNGKKDGTINVQNAEIARLNQQVQKDGDERTVLLIVAGLAGIVICVFIAVIVGLVHRAGAMG